MLVAMVPGATPAAQADDRSATTGRPNVIVIMADDFGYECVTANGGESYSTPNLDRLAAGGMRFTNCFVQPLCTPTRVQLMTGLYNVRNYIRFGLLDPEAVTFGHLMKKAGYATGIAGKWQLGQEKDLPQRFGFDESYLWQHTRRPPRYANPGLEKNGVEEDYSGGEYGPTLVNDFTLDYVTRHKDEPFFLYYPMMLTHSPYQPTPDSPNYDPKAVGEKVNHDGKHFADMTAYMDKMVGRLVAKLDELKIRERTLVIFTGDNGTGAGHMSKFQGKPFRGGKGSTTAHGMHVALIVNQPGAVPAGKVCDDLVASVDFLPTVCEAVGAKVPAPTAVDGRSFYPQLRGETGSPREWYYCWYAPDGGPTGIEFAATAGRKLYRNGRYINLETDLEEKNPTAEKELTGAEAETAARLRKALDQYTDARPEHLRKQPGGPKNKRAGLPAKSESGK
jgi:arylsulfatase A